MEKGKKKQKTSQDCSPHLHHASDQRAVWSTVPFWHGIKDPLCIIVLPVGDQNERDSFCLCPLYVTFILIINNNKYTTEY